MITLIIICMALLLKGTAIFVCFVLILMPFVNAAKRRPGNQGDCSTKYEMIRQRFELAFVIIATTIIGIPILML